MAIAVALAAAVLSPAGVHAAEQYASVQSDVSGRYHPPTVRETFVYADVRGNTVAELSESLLRRRHTQKLTVGSSYDASTRWEIDWHYSFESAPGSCTVNDFQASVAITFRYPRWEHDQPNPSLAAAWEAYLGNLVRHEKGHRDIAVAAAAALTRASSRLSAAASCEQLERKIDDMGRTLMKQLYFDQSAYDAETAHGAAQGAVFP